MSWDLFKGAIDIFKVAVPIAIFVFGISMTWGMIKWSRRLNESVKGISEKPGYIIITIIVISILLWVWFAYGLPLMPKG